MRAGAFIERRHKKRPATPTTGILLRMKAMVCSPAADIQDFGDAVRAFQDDFLKIIS